MINKYDTLFLEHISDALTKIEKFVKDVKYEDFLKNSLTQSGVIWQFLILGEAAQKISKEVRDIYPSIPWKDMAGMRNKLIHGYFEVDLKIVWDTIMKDVPILREQIKNILKVK